MHHSVELAEFFVKLFHDFIKEEFYIVGNVELVGGIKDKSCIFKDIKVVLLCLVMLLDFFGKLPCLDVLSSGVYGFEKAS